MEKGVGKIALLVVIIGLISQILGNPLNLSNVKAVEDDARQYLTDLEPRYSQACNDDMTVRWEYITNVTEENAEAAVVATSRYQEFQAQVQLEILDKFPDWNTTITDPSILRQFTYLATKGPAKMDSEKVKQMNQLISEMESAYATAKVCDYEDDPEECENELPLEPDLEDKLSTATDFDELAHYWTGWHDALSEAVPTSKYKEFIDLQNEYARANGYADMGELWASPYDDGSEDFSAKKFEEEMYGIWEDLRPLYEKLHAYVRMKLRKNSNYESKIKRFGYLPANLMGNMWAQDWTALDESTKPYPDEKSLDATKAMKEANYTELKMFQVSDAFFKGLGLLSMTEDFYNKSMITKPDDREVVCHASAEDFCQGYDFRIKMCTNINQEDLVTVHHEMGHIEYFMQYSNQAFIFRDGANPGFHEAIGDALALAVTTPYHLQCVLKLELGMEELCITDRSTVKEVTKVDINFLYRMALEKFSFFPFAISMDSWRWGVFNGSITETEYNSKWWEIRERNQGITPPSPRDPSGGLDAAAKYHIVGNVEYIRYFISHILQFQFYEAMCIKAGQYDPNNEDLKPLYQCDFDGNTDAGELFGEMMALGFSEPWPVALEKITGSKEMSVRSLKNYFQPLFDYIDTELAVNGEIAGFGAEFEEEQAKKYIALDGPYEKEATAYCNAASVAEFEYETDLLNATKEEKATAASIAYSQFELKAFKEFISQFDYENFQDPDLKRQLKFLSAIGTSALNDADLQRYNEVLSEMSKIYGTAKVCPYYFQACDLTSDGLALEPDLTVKFNKMENYEELRYLWKAWRDATGPKIRELYKEYVALSNKAATLTGFKDMGEFWLLRYESDTFKADLETVWNEVNEKLYKPLYSYVRFKLSQKYPQIDPEKPLPAHMFGNMWAQTWESVLPFVVPYPEEPTFDITKKLEEEASYYPTPFDQRRMLFDFANGYFHRNLGLEDMRDNFMPPAMIMKPEDREVICHASAWDMCDGKDFRIKMCSEINHDDFITVHHELGHIQYYHQYKNLPITYRTGANPGFHEAIGDVIALSVSSPAHLQRLGFIDAAPSDKSLLNYLMQMSLDKVAFLPFGYMIDNYRWKIFDGSIPEEELTLRWIEMRANYQGIVPPVKRNERDFDPGAKYHVPASTPYIRYFVSYILQFQLHQTFCELAGQNLVYNCDIGPRPNNPTPAAKELQKLLAAGGSKNWQELLQEVTNSSKLEAGPIIAYFQPLIEYFDEQQKLYNYSTEFNIGDIRDYYGQEELDPPATTTTTPTDSPISGATDPTGSPVTGTTDEDGGDGDATPVPDDDDDGTDTVAIVVGSILGVGVVVLLVGYFVFKRIRKGKQG